jgi:potassium channel subfamily K member 18
MFRKQSRKDKSFNNSNTTPNNSIKTKTNHHINSMAELDEEEGGGVAGNAPTLAKKSTNFDDNVSINDNEMFDNNDDEFIEDDDYGDYDDDDDDDDDEYEEELTPYQLRAKRIQQFKKFCTTVTTFLFSRVGLCIVVIGYVFIGGVMFKSIEGKFELEEKAKNKTLVNDIDTQMDLLVADIWTMTKREVIFHQKNYTNKLKVKLDDYQKNLTYAVKEGYKGNLNNNTTKWTFPGAILYSITIVTTIGFGHITCATDAGKIMTICYAILGIPLMLICLANIGSSMANLFRFLYAKVCCGYCNYVKRRNMRMRTALTLSNAAAATHVSAMSYAQATVGSINSNISTNNTIQQQQQQQIDNLSLKNDSFDYNNISTKKKAKQTEIDIIDLLDDANNVDYRKITVPISLSIMILSSYIIVGGIICQKLENWSILEGIYFCFITLSTIGLGDYVPGNSINDTDQQAEFKLVGVSFYLLMGLSLIAMCFNLMQEEVSAKFRRLAIRLGIIDDPNYW